VSSVNHSEVGIAKMAQPAPASFPPVVIHITDGESTDGDLEQAMNDIKNMSSQRPERVAV
jgi:hypothetical protein